MFKKELTPILHNFFQEIEEEEILLYSTGNQEEEILFHEVIINLKPKPDKDSTPPHKKTQLQTNIPHEYGHKND